MKDIEKYSKSSIENRLKFTTHKLYKYSSVSENGVVTIHFRIDLSIAGAILSGFTIAPGLWYLGDRAFNNGNGLAPDKTLFFDANSGNEITSEQAQENKAKNIKASILDKEGQELQSQEKYEEAYNKFDEAYKTCTAGFSEETRFEKNREIAKNNWADMLNSQGNELFNRCDFLGAFRKFEAAVNKCTENYKNEQSFRNSRIKAQKEIYAAALNSQGDSYFNRGEFGEAYKNYLTAYEISQVSEKYNLYKSNRDQALSNKTKNDKADQLDREGRELCGREMYEEAFKKFNDAYQTCTNRYAKQALFQSNRNVAKNCWANQLCSQGNVLFGQGLYSAAFSKFEKAFSNCTDDHTDKSSFQDKMIKMQIEIDAINLSEQGNVLFNQRLYCESLVKYKLASEKSQQKNKFKALILKAQHEIQAIAINNQGDCFYDQMQFDEAAKKYNEAIEKSQEFMQRSKFKDNREKAQKEIDAAILSAQGDQLFNQCEFGKAVKKYEKASNKTQLETIAYKYRNNILKAQLELDAAAFCQKGENLFNAGKYTEALSNFEAALNGSRVSNARSSYETSINKVKIEISASESFQKGELLYKEGKYREALSECTNAANLTKLNKQHFEKFSKKCKVADMNWQGDEMFKDGKFTAAGDMYIEAFGLMNSGLYKNNIKKVQIELEASELGKLGDELFQYGRLEESLFKYKEAFKKSQLLTQKSCFKERENRVNAKISNKTGYQILSEAVVENDIDKKTILYEKSKMYFEQAVALCPLDLYKNALKKSQNALEGAKLCQQGHFLFAQEKYEEASLKFREAHEKTTITKEKPAYVSLSRKVDEVITELRELAAIWEEAWDAESAQESDEKVAYASDLFRKLLVRSSENSIFFPEVSEFLKIKNKTSLKVEGNERYNSAVESENKAIELREAATGLTKKKEYDLALLKLIEAKQNFSEAQEKFKNGEIEDKRFSTCVQSVDECIKDVDDQIQKIELENSESLCNLNINVEQKSAPSVDIRNSQDNASHMSFAI